MQSENKFFKDVLIVALAVTLLLLIPLIAMFFSDQWNWGPFDFFLAWILLFSAGTTYKLTTRKSGNLAYKVAMGIAAATALFLVWSNLAVGIIGSEDNPANLMYLGVLAVLLIATFIASFKPERMALALTATASAQVLVTAIALLGEMGAPENTPVQLISINGFFVVFWMASALLFRYSTGARSLASR